VTPEIASADGGDAESLFEYAQGGLGPDERRTVEAHVSSCPDCRRVLAEALRGLAEADGVGEDGGSRGRIGRYSLVELLGAGASGVVYRAFDPELERTVALKLLRTDTSTENRERRLREARTMAQVSDPNVVTVFDAGLSGGSVYIVMEYVQGSTLEQWLGQEPRTLRQIVDAFVAAGRGLAALHARSLIHRDFKPENVMIGSDGRIQVTDFGLARAMASVETATVQVEGPAGNRMTLTQGLFGTPAYMAPELFGGKPADARSDQFSFAVALLSAATGHHPFGADERISVSELVLRMYRDRRELAEKARGLPTRLRDALLRSLSLDATERFPSMAALLSELERAPLPGARGTSRRTVWGAIAVLAVAVGVLAIGFGQRRTRPEPEVKVAVSPHRPEPEAPPPPSSQVANVVTPLPDSIEPSKHPEASASEKPVTAVHRAARAPGRAPSRREVRATPAPSEARYDDRLKDPF
jgi:serine/threonine protein kinase